MELTLVRHAEADRDAGAEPPLSERGKTQAMRLADRAKHWKKPNAVLVSPSLRAGATAAPLAHALGLEPEVAGWLAEVRAEVGANLDVAKASLAIDGGAMAELRARVHAGLAQVISAHGGAGADARLVLVGHGMAHAVALEYLLGVPPVRWAGLRFQFAHAAFAAVRAFDVGGEWAFGLVRYNETEHLPRELRSY
jgi:broad specificity phosphatase PhoE